MTRLDPDDRRLLDFLCACIHYRCHVRSVRPSFRASLRRLRYAGLVWFEGYTPSPSAMLEWSQRRFPQSPPSPGGAAGEEPPTPTAADEDGGAAARSRAAPPKRRKRNPKISKRAYNGWTEEELSVLRQHYPQGGLPAVVPLLPRHSARSIKTVVHKLALRATNSEKTKRLWTPEEDEVLATVYPAGGALAVQKLLPHRSYQSIYNRVSHAGIVRPQVKRAKAESAPDTEPASVPAIQVEAEPVNPPARSKRSLTFEEQLAKVAAGAPIYSVSSLRPPADGRTLGGVVGEIL